MKSKEKTIEVSIGVIDYTLDVIFWYTSGNGAIDPTEQTDTRLRSWEIKSQIHAYNTETEDEWTVSDINEYQMVQQWIDFQNEFDTI